MRHEEHAFSGGGGTKVVYDRWSPETDPVGAVVLSHGVAEHARRYDHVVERLGGLGLTVYAPDHRGHGRSEGRRMFVRGIHEFTEDLDTLFQQVDTDLPGKPQFLLGHSMGAMIALAYALDHQERLRGLALSGTPVLPGKGLSPVAISVARLLGRVAPGFPVQRLDARYISRDPAVVTKYNEDPLVSRDKLPAGLGGGMLNTMAEFRRRLPTLTVPTLVMHGSADRIVDPDGSRLIAEQAGAKDLELHVYDGLYHEIFNEPEQDSVLTDLTDWLRKRL